MDALECITSRRSIRKFNAQPVKQEIVEQIVQKAAFAPSWKNTQTVRYNLILDAEKKQMIADRYVLGFTWNQHTITDAPALMVISTVTGRSGYEKDGTFSTSQGTHWQSFDAGIATQTFCLAAHAMGLGSVVMGIFDENGIAETIDLPSDEKVAALVALGWPEGTHNAPKRKSIEELLRVME